MKIAPLEGVLMGALILAMAFFCAASLPDQRYHGGIIEHTN